MAFTAPPASKSLLDRIDFGAANSVVQDRKAAFDTDDARPGDQRADALWHDRHAVRIHVSIGGNRRADQADAQGLDKRTGCRPQGQSER